MSGTPRPRCRGEALMGRRIDYHHDPDAPAANSIVPSVNVAVTNDVGRGPADPPLRQRQLGVAGRWG